MDIFRHKIGNQVSLCKMGAVLWLVWGHMLWTCCNEVIVGNVSKLEFAGVKPLKIFRTPSTVELFIES